jgi:V/A-type H+-transporting ATPase subunit C
LKDTEYAYSVAFVRTLENKMLSKGDIDILINAKSAQDAMRILADKGYGGGEIAPPSDIELILKNELESAWQNVREACPDGAPIDVLLYKNDFHNLKTILKATHSSVSWENLMLRPCTVEPQLIADAVMQGRLDTLPELLRAPAAEAYDILTRTGDGQLVEVILDKAVFTAMMNSVKNYDFFKGYIELNCDIVNIKTAIRGAKAHVDRRLCEHALVPYGKTDVKVLADAIVEGVDAVYEVLTKLGYRRQVEAAQSSLSELEKLCDNMLIDYIKGYKNRAFGFEPILGYLKGKETELQSVRIIISGHINNVPKETITERLREMYV